MNYALTALLVFCLIAWGFVLVPPAVRLLNGVVRPSDSISSFRNKMSVLSGSTPSTLRGAGVAAAPAGPRAGRPAEPEPEVEGFGIDLRDGADHAVLDLAAHRRARPNGADVARRRAAKRRRRNIFTGLLAALPVTFLLAVVFGGPAWVLFMLTMVAFAAYTALLWQMQQAALERGRKVAVLPTGPGAVAQRGEARHVSLVAR
ncbi:MAG: hypothetical protein U5K29_11070 [Acidimicrobiales bacterium]|nr:hypothetical protein [Acidimicrobiales bacterium]